MQDSCRNRRQSTLTIRVLGALIGILVTLCCGQSVWAQANSAKRSDPTHRDVAYGEHARHRFDLWLADSQKPTPLVLYIHGGGFRGGSKDGLQASVRNALLQAGISVAAIEYRLLDSAYLPAAHHDCRQALQFIRQHADQWNIDKNRIGAFGGSAGAQICMWLAFHEDMARPASREPIERESTRLACVATTGGQTTMEFSWWREHIPGYRQPHRPSSEYFGDAQGAELERVIRDISALSLLSKDDPPIWMSYRMAPDDPLPTDAGAVQGWQVHHVNFGIALKESAEKLQLESHLKHPGATCAFDSLSEFFIAKLRGSETSTQPDGQPG